MPRTLTDKQERFVQEYLIDLNATAAAERAGYSAKTARQTGSENLSKPYIAERIAEIQSERSERTRVTADQVVEELARIAFSDVQDYASVDDGRLTLAPEADPLATRAVQSVKWKRKRYTQRDEDVEETDTEIRLWSKTAALDSLAKHLGMYGPKGTADDPTHVVMDAPTPEERMKRLAELSALSGASGA